MDNSNNIFLLLFSITMEINIFIIIYYNKYRIYTNIYKYTYFIMIGNILIILLIIKIIIINYKLLL